VKIYYDCVNYFYAARAAKAGMIHSVIGWTRVVQIELWDPLRTRAIPERLRGVITTRRYTNPRLPLLYLTTWLKSNVMHKTHYTELTSTKRRGIALRQESVTFSPRNALRQFLLLYYYSPTSDLKRTFKQYPLTWGAKFHSSHLLSTEISRHVQISVNRQRADGQMDNPKKIMLFAYYCCRRHWKTAKISVNLTLCNNTGLSSNIVDLISLENNTRWSRRNAQSLMHHCNRLGFWSRITRFSPKWSEINW